MPALDPLSLLDAYCLALTLAGAVLLMLRGR